MFEGLNISRRPNFKDVEFFSKKYGVTKKFLLSFLNKNNYFKIKYEVFTSFIKFDDSLFEGNIVVGTLEDIIPLYHSNYYKYDYAFKNIKNIKFVCIMYKEYDYTDIMFIFASNKDKNLFRDNLKKLTSFKKKAVFTNQELDLLKTINKKYNTINFFNSIDYEIERLKSERYLLIGQKRSLDNFFKQFDSLPDWLQNKYVEKKVFRIEKYNLILERLEVVHQDILECYNTRKNMRPYIKKLNTSNNDYWDNISVYYEDEDIYGDWDNYTFEDGYY